MRQKICSISRLYFCFISISLLLHYPAQAQTSKESQDLTFDMKKAEKEIEKRLRDYENALRNEDLEALGNLYAIDAEILHNGRSSTVGRDKT